MSYEDSYERVAASKDDVAFYADYKAVTFRLEPLGPVKITDEARPHDFNPDRSATSTRCRHPDICLGHRSYGNDGPEQKDLDQSGKLEDN